MEKVEKVKKVEIDRRFCVGLFILGVLGHYSSSEIAKDSGLRYIAEVLRKKHFELKNGTVEMRTWASPSYVNKQIKRNPKKRDEYIKKGQRAVAKRIEVVNRWTVHSRVADNAWIKATYRFDKNNAITTNQLIFALLRKNPDVLKWYKFNPKKIESILKPRPNTDNYIIQSSRVATALLEELDAEIAYYNADSEYYLNERTKKIKEESKML
jgi:hypothetical protein